MSIDRSIRQVTIGLRKIPVSWDEEACKEGHGFYNSVPSPHINVCSTLDDDEKVYSLWHETFEAVNDLYGLELAEQGIRVMENVLVGIIRSNPKLVEFTQALDKRKKT